jgi:hypothetical protein
LHFERTNVASIAARRISDSHHSWEAKAPLIGRQPKGLSLVDGRAAREQGDSVGISAVVCEGTEFGIQGRGSCSGLVARGRKAAAKITDPNQVVTARVKASVNVGASSAAGVTRANGVSHRGSGILTG